MDLKIFSIDGIAMLYLENWQFHCESEVRKCLLFGFEILISRLEKLTLDKSEI